MQCAGSKEGQLTNSKGTQNKWSHLYQIQASDCAVTSMCPCGKAPDDTNSMGAWSVLSLSSVAISGSPARPEHVLEVCNTARLLSIGTQSQEHRVFSSCSSCKSVGNFPSQIPPLVCYIHSHCLACVSGCR